MCLRVSLFEVNFSCIPVKTGIQVGRGMDSREGGSGDQGVTQRSPERERGGFQVNAGIANAYWEYPEVQCGQLARGCNLPTCE